MTAKKLPRYFWYDDGDLGCNIYHDFRNRGDVCSELLCTTDTLSHAKLIVKALKKLTPAT